MPMYICEHIAQAPVQGARPLDATAHEAQHLQATPPRGFRHHAGNVRMLAGRRPQLGARAGTVHRNLRLRRRYAQPAQERI